MDIYVIRRDAGLPGIRPFAEGDPSGRELHISVMMDDAGALAAELQRDRNQAGGRCLHDELADRDAAGEENIIERPGQQLPGRLGVPCTTAT